MYTWLNNQGIRSPDGLEIQYLDRFTLEVRMGPRHKRFEVEGVVLPSDFDRHAFDKWDNSSVPNDVSTADRLLGSFRQALAYMNDNAPASGAAPPNPSLERP